jgi:hypothetical protein
MSRNKIQCDKYFISILAPVQKEKKKKDGKLYTKKITHQRLINAPSARAGNPKHISDINVKKQ